MEIGERTNGQIEAAGRSFAAALAHLGNDDLVTFAALLRATAKFIEGEHGQRKLAVVAMSGQAR